MSIVRNCRNIQTATRLYMPNVKKFVNLFGDDIGREVTKVRGQVNQLAKKNKVNIFMTPYEYSFGAGDKSSNYIIVEAQKPLNSFKEKLKDFFKHLNPFNMDNCITAFPLEQGFSRKTLVAEIKKLIEQVKVN